MDKSKAESMVNLTGNQKVVLAVANGFLVAGGLLLHSVTKVAVGAEASAHCCKYRKQLCFWCTQCHSSSLVR